MFGPVSTTSRRSESSGQVVGHERPFPGHGERALHHRVPALHDLDHVGPVDQRPHPSRVCGDAREREKRVGFGRRRGAGAQIGAPGQHGGPQLLEDLLLQGRPALLGRQHSGLVLGESGHDEPLRADRRGAPLVVAGTRWRLGLVTSM